MYYFVKKKTVLQVKTLNKKKTSKKMSRNFCYMFFRKQIFFKHGFFKTGLTVIEIVKESCCSFGKISLLI